MARFLREQRERLELSLRDVERITDREGKIIPFSTLARIELGALDPGVKRLRQLFELYDVPFEVLSDLMDLEDLAEEMPDEEDPDRLFELGVAEWKQGNLRQGLACFSKLKLTVGDERPHLRQKAHQRFAVAAGSLGKSSLSLHLIEGLLREGDALDPELLIPTLVQAAANWHRLGSVEAALAFVARAKVHVKEGDHAAAAWLFHQEASILVTSREYAAADAALGQALTAYENVPDPSGYGRALGVGVRRHLQAGDAAAALEAARSAARHARENHLDRIAALRQIDEGHSLRLLGRLDEAVGVLARALSQTLASEDAMARFYAHYHLWCAYVEQKDDDAAETQLRLAHKQLHQVDDVTPETIHVKGEALKRERRRKRQG